MNEKPSEEKRAFPVLRDFRVHDGHCPKFIRWDVLDEGWAQKIHGQTLTRLAERGGLSPCEALANIERREWHRMNYYEACKQLKQYEVVP